MAALGIQVLAPAHRLLCPSWPSQPVWDFPLVVAKNLSYRAHPSPQIKEPPVIRDHKKGLLPWPWYKPEAKVQEPSALGVLLVFRTKRENTVSGDYMGRGGSFKQQCKYGSFLRQGERETLARPGEGGVRAHSGLRPDTDVLSKWKDIALRREEGTGGKRAQGPQGGPATASAGRTRSPPAGLSCRSPGSRGMPSRCKTVLETGNWKCSA